MPACIPREEGVYAPFDPEETKQNAIADYFTGAKWNGWCFQGIDAETASFLDAAFAQSEMLSCLKVDRSRLDESQEAWIYVTVEEPAGEPEFRPFAGFGTCRAVLTWPNSD